MPLGDILGLGSSIVGQKQLGAAAPAFNPQGGGLLDVAGGDDELEQMLAALAAQSNFQPPQESVAPLSDLVGPPPSAPVGDTTNDEMGPPSPEGDPLAKPQGFGGLLNSAFENVDQNLQSPAKVLGLGLLSSIDPRLAQGGLLASAVFGKNKLF